MIKSRYLAAAALAGAAIMSSPALAADSPVVGSWAIATQTQMGTFKATMNVTDKDGAYMIDIKDKPPEGGGGGGAGPGGPPPKMTISDVMVDGSNFSFKRTIEGGQGSFVLNYSGTVDGDMLTGKASSNFGDSDVTGTRIKE